MVLGSSPVAVTYTSAFAFTSSMEVPWQSGNYRVWINSETRTWHDRSIQLKRLSWSYFKCRSHAYKCVVAYSFSMAVCKFNRVFLRNIPSSWKLIVLRTSNSEMFTWFFDPECICKFLSKVWWCFACLMSPT